MLGFPILYCKGMRPMMFQLSGFCYIHLRARAFDDVPHSNMSLTANGYAPSSRIVPG